MSITQDRITSFSSVTELPGQGSTPEGLKMVYSRYKTAGDIGEGKDLLEVACGPGMGLGYLAKRCKSVTAGDFDPDMVARVRAQYGERIAASELDAMSLPFPDATFDVVIIMEALYFVPEPETAIAEAARVLKPAGKLFIASANRDWTSFNAAPFTSRYLNAGELKECFANNGLSAEISFGFPEGKRGLKSKALSLARKAVVKMHLIPDTMEGKEKLKKLAYGKLEPLPAEFSEISETTETFVSDEYAINSNIYKVVYAIGTKG